MGIRRIRKNNIANTIARLPMRLLCFPSFINTPSLKTSSLSLKSIIISQEEISRYRTVMTGSMVNIVITI